MRISIRLVHVRQNGGLLVLTFRLFLHKFRNGGGQPKIFSAKRSNGSSLSLYPSQRGKVHEIAYWIES
jgi:hypothetical protein